MRLSSNIYTYVGRVAQIWIANSAKCARIAASPFALLLCCCHTSMAEGFGPRTSDNAQRMVTKWLTKDELLERLIQDGGPPNPRQTPAGRRRAVDLVFQTYQPSKPELFRTVHNPEHDIDIQQIKIAVPALTEDESSDSANETAPDAPSSSAPGE